MDIILTHQNADFDAIASMLGAWKLQPHALAILPSRLQQNVEEFIALYGNGLPYIAWDDFKPTAAIQHITLTDCQSRPELEGLASDIPTLIIEHHPLERKLRAHEKWAGEMVGAASTLLVERLQTEKIPLNALEATVLALGIYSDTGMLTYGGTTARDLRAAAWLLEQGAALDTIQRFLASPLNTEQQALFEQLFETAQHRNLKGYNITLCQTESAKSIGGINSVAASLRDVLNADALFVLVQMPKTTQLVCRSKTDAIHVGIIAQRFGGGGHARAAAATLYKGDLNSLSQELWDTLHQVIDDSVKVADLMSYGVQTVEVQERIEDIIQRIRRIGHEGYPVLEDGRVVGLLTLRDADRALEHGLTESSVRDVMLGGAVTLTPDDSISLLEETMVKSDWGQIPIINGYGALIGIVTRTDLIKHWAKVHPRKNNDLARLDVQHLRTVLGESRSKVIETLAQIAQQQGLAFYMVGGVVRDLLLERPNFDIDFVLEGDAISFANRLAQTFGGKIHSHKPFGTAKWLLDERVAQAFGLKFADLPDHLDFATARSELYEHPTALPTVYNSGIKLDLRRRDFTINTLAIQLSPEMWQILDFYGGLADLQARRIRVLHSLSFVDDPTRIIRAVRFSERLHFPIEARTAELIQTALPMLRRITGERIRNELDLLLQEEYPLQSFLKLAALGVLTAIHPQFQLRPTLNNAFKALHRAQPQWAHVPDNLVWHIFMAQVDYSQVVEISRRLLFSQKDAEDFQKTALLAQSPNSLPERPSDLDQALHIYSPTSLLAAYLLLEGTAQAKIDLYMTKLRHLKPRINGNDLKKRGLAQGSEYRFILERLRIAWLDGTIQNPLEEESLLEELIQEFYQ